MIDAPLIISCIFFAVAVSAAVGYSRYLVRVKKEYERAKEAFSDVILSFSRELQRTADSVQAIQYKMETTHLKGDEAVKKVEDFAGQLKILETKTNGLLEEKGKMLARLNEVEKQMHDIITSLEGVVSKISKLEEHPKYTPVFSETGVETVIPIRRERALAHLTETELAVLEMLVAEGPKTAPEIKERIKLSREHTARLMKKLYEEGYLERDSSKIPFKYGVKKEMERILKKTETEAPKSS